MADKLNKFDFYEMIAEYAQDPTLIVEDYTRISSLGFDELDFVDISMHIEHKYNIEVPENYCDKFLNNTALDFFKSIESIFNKE